MIYSPPIAAPICCPSDGGGDLLPILLAIGILLAGHAFFRKYKKHKGQPEMKNLKNPAIVAALVVAAGIVFILKQQSAKSESSSPAVGHETVQAAPDAATPAIPAALPRMVDLGADKCIPCKMMAPILEEMKTTYADQLHVEFIDVWKNPDAGEKYGVRIIPTQIFYDAQGKELFRHEGFFAKEDMLAKWKELGVDLQPKTTP